MTKEQLSEQLEKAKAEQGQLVARTNIITGYIAGLEYALKEEAVSAQPAPVEEGANTKLDGMS